MKKCPYCAEDIQDEAVTCKWCRRDLSQTNRIMVRLKKIIIVSILCLGLFSIFLPLVHLDLPIFGRTSYSVFSIIKQSFSKDSGAFLSAKDIRTIQGDIQKNIPKKYLEKLNQKDVKLFLTIIKASAIILIVSYAAYILVIILGILGLRKPVVIFSLISFLCAGYSLVVIFFLNQALQKAISLAQVKMSDEPFAGIFSAVFQNMEVTSGRALYVLAATMASVFLLSLCWKMKKT